MIKVKYTNGTDEDFDADNWEISDDYVELTKTDKEDEEEVIALVFTQNVLSIQ